MLQEQVRELKSELKSKEHLINKLLNQETTERHNSDEYQLPYNTSPKRYRQDLAGTLKEELDMVYKVMAQRDTEIHRLKANKKV